MSNSNVGSGEINKRAYVRVVTIPGNTRVHENSYPDLSIYQAFVTMLSITDITDFRRLHSYTDSTSLSEANF